MDRLIGFAGIFTFLLIAWLLSHNRRSIHWKTVLWGLGLQWVFAVMVLKGEWVAIHMSWIPFPTGTGWAIAALMLVPALLTRFLKFSDKRLNWTIFGVVSLGLLRGNLVAEAFDRMRGVVDSLMKFANEGAKFVFGPLASPTGAEVLASGSRIGSIGMIFAFVVLPTIIFIASIFAILYYFGVMQWVVGAAARAIVQFLKVSGAESVSVAASIVMGQTEAPLTIRPFLSRMTLSELMVIMTAGMAHVSGSIMVAYVQMAHVDIVHLLTAVIMTAPGAIMLAKILEPETETPETSAMVKIDVPTHDANVLDAAARGAGDGLHLALNVAAMLIAFIALVALVNGILKGTVGFDLETLLGWIFRPFAFLMGVPWAEAGTIGSLLGKRMVLNEFVAFLYLGEIAVISAKAKLIATFALCGFANFSSIAIQLGGIGALVPERRSDLARLGLRAMLAGTMANFLSACIAGILI
jgi:CNT family concentrative nucleoside transporter